MNFDGPSAIMHEDQATVDENRAENWSVLLAGGGHRSTEETVGQKKKNFNAIFDLNTSKEELQTKPLNEKPMPIKVKRN
jgi:hypothetical protein